MSGPEGEQDSPHAESEGDGSQPKTSRTAGSGTSVRVERPYPRRPLEQAMRVANVIKEKNAGRPWPPTQIAEALQIKARSSNFTYITGAAREYGLTRTNSDSTGPLIELTDLGRDLVFPQSSGAEELACIDAFLRVDLFRKLLEYYGGNNLPEWKFLSNTLQTNFGLDPSVHEEFIELFDKNCRFLGIGHEWPTPDQGESSKRPIIIEGSVGDVEGRGSSTVVQARGTGVGCFVIMPFTERDERYEVGFFTEVFNSLLKPALALAGFDAYTALRQGTDVIQATIVNELLRAEMVVADLTEHNPNVLFELGMRMHADRPVSLIRAKGTGPIFDVDGMLRVLDYNPNLWASTVEADKPRIAEHVRVTWENRAASQTFMSILSDRAGDRINSR